MCVFSSGSGGRKTPTADVLLRFVSKSTGEAAAGGTQGAGSARLALGAGGRQASVTGAGVHGLLAFPRGRGGSEEVRITTDKKQEVLGRRRCCLAAEL